MNLGVKAILLLVLIVATLNAVLVVDAKKPDEDGGSFSSKELKGWYRIHVVGTGKKCLVKEKSHTRTKGVEFGDAASTDASADYYGVPKCEPGDKGNAKGRVRLSVLAQASSIGEECVAKVIAFVLSETKANRIHDDVQVAVGGEALGEADVYC